MFIIIFGIMLVIALFQIKKFTHKFLSELYVSIMYVLEFIVCIQKKTVLLFSNNAVVSVFLMILIPIIILGIYVFIHTIITHIKK